MSNNKNNPFSSFILDYCEHSAPQAKQAVDDWRRFCTACMDGGLKVQRSAMKVAGLKTIETEDAETMWRNMAESWLDAQAEFSKASITASVKAVENLLK